jgi:hypothetical protein
MTLDSDSSDFVSLLAQTVQFARTGITVWYYIQYGTSVLLTANHNMVAYGTAGIQAHHDQAPKA